MHSLRINHLCFVAIVFSIVLFFIQLEAAEISDAEFNSAIVRLQKYVETNQAPKTCDVNHNQTGKTCSFANICEALMPNRNSKNIYENKAGHYLPNYSLKSAKDIIQSCESIHNMIKSADPEVSKKNRKKDQQ